MTTAQVVETSVTVNNNSPIQDYVHPDDQTQPTFEMTLGFKPFTTKQKKVLQQGAHLPPAPVISAFSFFAFLLEILLREQKAAKDQFLRTPLICLIITSPLGFYKTKKVLQQGAYLPPAPVISAFSFFVFLLEILLREQKAAKDQFLRTAWYATIIKSQYLGFTKQKGSATKYVPSCDSGDFCFFLFPFSFGVSAMNLKSNEVFSFMPCESVSKNSPRSMYENCNMAPRL